MKMIGKDIYKLLTDATKLPVETINPNIISPDRVNLNFVQYKIYQNTPDTFADDMEIISAITVVIYVFSENFNTDETILKIDEAIHNKFYDAERVDLTAEENFGEYVKREISYIIYC